MTPASSSSEPLTLSAPAKVNLALSVASPHRDAQGRSMHAIAGWFVAVTLEDTVELQPADPPSAASFTVQAVDEPQWHGRRVDWPIESDLAFRAHAMMQEAAGRALPVRVRVTKRIPPGAGLGGGSSDAAAVLTGLNRMFALGHRVEDLAVMGRTLGSDVVFAVHALDRRTSALVTGTGEVIAPCLLSAGPLHLVLIFPPFGCPTGPVYAAFDRQLTGEKQADEPRVRALAGLPFLPQDGPFNDLADAACAVQPRLRELMDHLRTTLHLPVHVTGSGSTLFVVSPSAITAQATARRITQEMGLPALAVRSRSN